MGSHDVAERCTGHLRAGRGCPRRRRRAHRVSAQRERSCVHRAPGNHPHRRSIPGGHYHPRLGVRPSDQRERRAGLLQLRRAPVQGERVLQAAGPWLVAPASWRGRGRAPSAARARKPATNKLLAACASAPRKLHRAMPVVCHSLRHGGHRLHSSLFDPAACRWPGRAIPNAGERNRGLGSVCSLHRHATDSQPAGGLRRHSQQQARASRRLQWRIPRQRLGNRRMASRAHRSADQRLLLVWRRQAFAGRGRCHPAERSLRVCGARGSGRAGRGGRKARCRGSAASDNSGGLGRGSGHRLSRRQRRVWVRPGAGTLAARRRAGRQDCILQPILPGFARLWPGRRARGCVAELVRLRRSMRDTGRFVVRGSSRKGDVQRRVNAS
mmetsp:Transcript_21496/g.81856  ORF Transcript_21496/g.81856 Transcript_21496/m.81856 type:complete len:383 (+) Transcript_21496:1096-2244(+)